MHYSYYERPSPAPAAPVEAGPSEASEEGRPPLIPERYGVTRIVLQVRDSFWLHAYWEIADDASRNMERELGAELGRSHMVIRVYDVTEVAFNGSNAWSSRDIPVHPFADNWYVEIGSPDRSYCADLGLVTPASQFHLIVRSNTVHTPPSGPSDVVDEEWLSIREIQHLSPKRPSSAASPGGPGGFRSRQMEREIAIGSGGVGAVSSPSPYPPGAIAAQNPRGFWLTADAELIVYGATEPGSTVEIFNSPVRVAPDGSFSVRLAFPAGESEIPVRARSADGIMERHGCLRIARTGERIGGER